MEAPIEGLLCMQRYYSSTGDGYDGQPWDWVDMLTELMPICKMFSAAPRKCFTELPFDIAPLVEYPNRYQRIRVKRVYPDEQSKEDLHGYWWAKILSVQGYYLQLQWEGYTEDERKLNKISTFWLHVLDLLYKDHPTAAESLVPPVVIKQVSEDELRTRIAEMNFPAKTGSETAPVYTNIPDEAILKAFPFPNNGTETIVEVRDLHHVNIFRRAKLVECIGFRARLDLQFENGATETFYCDPAWENLHPEGWAKAIGIELSADEIKPVKKGSKKGSREREEKTVVVAKKARIESPYKIEVGQIFELVHPIHYSSIVVGEVIDVLPGGYFYAKILSQVALQHLADNANSTNSFLYNIHSNYIFPCGTCERSGRPEILEPPLQRPDGNFSWRRYFKWKTTATPLELPPRKIPEDGEPQFKIGDLLDATDLSSLNFIAPAFVTDVVRPFLIKLHFLGWQPNFDQWRPIYDPHIYPIGWVRTMCYPLSPPGSQTEPAICDTDLLPTIKEEEEATVPDTDTQLASAVDSPESTSCSSEESVSESVVRLRRYSSKKLTSVSPSSEDEIIQRSGGESHKVISRKKLSTSKVSISKKKSRCP